MTSEIRANTIKNRVGLGTVSYTNTGIVVSGIVTANSFSSTGPGDLQVINGHINISSGYSYQWGDSHERIEQSNGKIEFFTNNGEKMTLSGNNLGIGTVSPNSKLRIHNNSDDSAIVWLSGADVTSEYLSLGVQSGLAVIRGGGTGSTSCALSFETSTSGTEGEKMRLDANGVLKLGSGLTANHVNNAPSDIKFFLNSGRGNYGGLSSNAVIFDNQTAAVNAGGTLTLAGFTGSGAIAKAAIRGGNEGSASTNNGYFAVFTRPTSGNLTERIRINSAGEVYIGSATGNGQGKLFVNDSSGATTTQAHIRNAVSTGTAKVFLNLDDVKYASVGLENGSLVFRNSTSSTPTERLRIASDGVVSIGTQNKSWHSAYKVLQVGAASLVGQVEGDGTTSNWSNNAYFDQTNVRWEYSGSASDQASQITLSDGLILFKTASAGTADNALTWVETLRIESGGGLKFTGQGTSIPVGGILHHTNNNLYVRGGTSGLILGNQDSTTTVQIFNGYIKFETDDGNERLRIDSSGNAILKTANAAFKSESSSSGDYVKLYAGSGTGKWDIYGNGQYLRITDNDSAGSVRTDCRLGVGSAASHANLCSRITATGAIPTTGLIQTNNDNHALQLWNQSNSATYCGLMLETRTSGASGWLIANEWKSTYAGDLVIRGRSGGTSSSERLRITSGGNIGINRSDPNQRLNVNGNIEVNAYDNTSGGNGYYTAKGLIIGNAYDAGKTSTDDRNAIIWNERGLDLDFATSDTLRMKIDHTGNIGMGEDEPNRAKLHVRGADSTTSIIAKFRNPSSSASSKTKVALVTGYGDHNQDTEGHAYIGAQRGSTGNTTSLFFETSTGSSVHERMRISKDGYVTKPQTPAFFATHTGASNSIIGTLTYNTSGNGYYNNGGHLNVGTGKFQAPCNGIYHFHFHGFFQVNQSSNYFEVTMRRENSNGTNATSLTRQYGYRDQPTNQYGPSISMHCTTYLNLGQTVEVITSGLSFHGSNGYYFGGHLVG